MNLSATISVIIPNYNYGRFIGEAIESALAQTYQPIEIIVVDDGSTDNSVKIVEAFGGKIKFVQQENSGVGKARNTGVQNSKGDLLAFLDADDVWLPNKLERQVILFQNQSRYDYVSCGMQEFDASGKTIGEYIPLNTSWSTKGILLFNERINASGSAIIVKKEAFEKVGGFDEQRDLHPSEDWDFARRISEICVIGATPDILVKYRNHGANGHLNIPRFEHSMTLAFEKAFENVQVDIQKLKRQSYGNLHRVLAGSYLNAGDYGQFIRHSLKSFWLTPQNLIYFSKFPFRKLKRKFN